MDPSRSSPRLGATEVMGWLVFSQSSYSPLNLRHLPQPIPLDAAASPEPGSFTFEDAFEDLLAVSSGRELPDIASVRRKRRLLRDVFPHGEPEDFWIRRLEQNGLLQPFPGQFAGLNHFSMRPFYERFHDEFARAAVEEEHPDRRGGRKCSERRCRGDTDVTFADRMIGDLTHLVKSFESKLGDVWPADADRPALGPKDQGAPPRAADDLYAAVQSAFAQGKHSLHVFLNSLKDGAVVGKDIWPGSGQNRRVETVQEFVDPHGNFHVRTTIKTLDENGIEIARETRESIESRRMHAASSAEGKRPKGEPNSDARTTEKGKPDKNGWYWR